MRGWPLWEETRDCPHVGHSQFQLAPNWTQHWPKLSPISDAGGTSVITYLGQGKKCCAAAMRERNKKNMRETTPQTPKSVRSEGEEVLQAPEQGFPAGRAEPTLGQAYPEGLPPVERTRCCSRGGVWGGRSGREGLLRPDHNSPSSWATRGGGRRRRSWDEGATLSLGKGQGGRREKKVLL